MRRSAVAALLLVTALCAVLSAHGVVIWLGPRSVRDAFFSLAVGSFTVVGAVIVWKRAANRVGWLFAAVGLLWLTGDLAYAYASYATTGSAEGLPFVTLAAWYGEWFWIPWIVSMFSLIPMLFPTGRPLSPRWATVAKLVCGFAVVATAAAMLESELEIVGTDAVVANPIGIPGFQDVERGVWSLPFFIGLMSSIVAGLIGVVSRFRRSRGDERQQLKWFALAAGALIVEFIGQVILDAVVGYRIEALDAIVVLLVPAAAAVAILRYRLYDIDLVINRALVYALLTAVLGAAYIGLVFGFQELLAPITAESDLAIAASTLAVAALFRPVRARVQAFIDQRFYRRKFDAQRTLEEFSLRLRDEVDLGNLSAELAAVVGETVQPAHVSLWLRDARSSAS